MYPTHTPTASPDQVGVFPWQSGQRRPTRNIFRLFSIPFFKPPVYCIPRVNYNLHASYVDTMLGLDVGTVSPLRLLDRDPHQDLKPFGWRCRSHRSISLERFHSHPAVSWIFWHSSCIESPGLEQSCGVAY